MPLAQDVLLTDVVLLDPASTSTNRASILIRDGVIQAISDDITAPDGVEVYDGRGRFVSPGWMDMHVHFRDPGLEYKETIETGAAAAAFGGFTAVACMPNTKPAVHTRDVVEYIVRRGAETPVDVHPIAAVTKDRAGKELTEMGDLADGGAVAFSDDGSPVFNGGVMRRALEYSAMFQRPIINHMEDLGLNPEGSGHMHEGLVATRLGLPGIPALAEEVMIARDIMIAGFTGGHIHVAHISTAYAVQLVREAKARGIHVTSEACTHHFTLTDEAVEASHFDTNTKMHPPLRTADDVAGIKEGLRDGTIDAICTDHAPHAAFEKEVEFIAAPFGIIGLETAWGLVGRELIATGVLTPAEAVRKLAIEPRKILGLPVPELRPGATASLTVFDCDTRWTFKKEHIRSRSHNTPFIGSEMTGRAWAIYNKGRLVVNA